MSNFFRQVKNKLQELSHSVQQFLACPKNFIKSNQISGHSYINQLTVICSPSSLHTCPKISDHPSVFPIDFLLFREMCARVTMVQWWTLVCFISPFGVNFYMENEYRWTYIMSFAPPLYFVQCLYLVALSSIYLMLQIVCISRFWQYTVFLLLQVDPLLQVSLFSVEY